MENQITRKILFDEEALLKVAAGANKLAKAVGSTYGANGKNVLISRIGIEPFITKDGVTVAKHINLSDPIENIGAQIIKNAASKTADIAGDGTTTATLLTDAILTFGIDYSKQKQINPIHLKRAIDAHANETIKELRNIAVHIDDDMDKLRNIATISANGDKEIGGLISDTFRKIGVDGIVHLEPSNTFRTEVEIVQGIKFNGGYVSEYFINNQPKQHCELNGAYVFVTDEKITTLNDILPVMKALELISKEENSNKLKPLVIIADDVQGEALSTLVANTVHGRIECVCIKSGFFSVFKNDALKDITIATGAKLISEKLGERISEVTPDKLGYVEQIIVTDNYTNIIPSEDNRGKILAHTEEIKVALAENQNTDLEDGYRTRIANLNSNVAKIKVGAATELEMSEKKDRIDDAVKATKSALEEGYVPGGGLALLQAFHQYKSKHLSQPLPANEADSAALKIMEMVVQKPLFHICSNSGLDFKDTIKSLANKNYEQGINALTGAQCDMIESGIIDPVKVVRVALENAVSIASTLLTTDCIVTEY